LHFFRFSDFSVNIAIFRLSIRVLENEEAGKGNQGYTIMYIYKDYECVVSFTMIFVHTVHQFIIEVYRVYLSFYRLNQLCRTVISWPLEY